MDPEDEAFEGLHLESLNRAFRGEQITFYVQVEQRKEISREAAKKDKHLVFASFAASRDLLV